ncbi:MAG: FecR domain-containing protein [Bacteriovoracaceae bacterium]|jgi:hypothetical protein|nr:FecR domain-containing protein [Bacteriovoracaceae bacterium]
MIKINAFITTLFFAILSLTSAYCADHSGTVMLLRGDVKVLRSKKESPLTKGSFVHQGDIIKTGNKSFVKISMNDETMLSLGPLSRLVIQEFKYKKGSLRKTIYNLVEGKMRSLIRKKAKEKDIIQVNSDVISIAVRGTEILSNSYLVKGNATNDVMLLSGKAQGHVVGMKGGMLDLEAGQAFNSSSAVMEGPGSAIKISTETLKALKKNPNKFLPNMQDALGQYINLENVLRKGLSLAPLAAIGGAAIGLASGLVKGAARLMAEESDKKEEKLKVKPMAKKNEKKKLLAKDILNHKNIMGHKGKVKWAKLPQDILEAYLNRKKMRKDGACYYWFYKKIPGYGDTERFRRERDCVDYDYDL